MKRLLPGLLATLILISQTSWLPGEETRGRMKAPVAGHQLHYLLQAPTGDAPRDGWPLLLFLHGYGECGNDLEKVKVHGPPKLISKFDALAGCVIVSPQCPRNSWWRVEALKALVEEVIQERGDIDRQRLYVTGLSMGGYGIWSFISHHPDYFAAAIPVCGGGDPFRLPANRPPVKTGIKNEFDPAGLKRASKLPLWTFHGTRDRSVPIVETQRLVKILQDAGSSQVKFTTYEDAGHGAAWKKAYQDPETWKWLFAKKLARPATDGKSSSLPGKLKPYFSPPPAWEGKLGNYRSPLKFAAGKQVKTAADWKRRRAEILSEWQTLLGKWPPLDTNPKVEILASKRRENFMQHRIRFAWTPHRKTTGYLLIPVSKGPHPAVVTVFYEPETAIGEGSPNRDFAVQLARRGFVALSLGTTEASQAKTYSLYYPSLENAQVQPLSMLGYAACTGWYVLANRPEVDAKRIGIVGHSFGGKWAMFASCLFDRFACTAWSDPGIVFDDVRSSINYWEPWYLGYHPKPWRKRGLITPDNPARGLYPKLRAANRDLHELHALMAPRPLLISGGSEDSPQRWEALNHTIAVNRLLGYENRVGMTNRPDHSPNDESNAVIYAFFEHFLQSPQK
ncbi:MAG: prolyl oligopeptidase family serine peptidase [Pirellulaceae bacterium]